MPNTTTGIVPTEAGLGLSEAGIICQAAVESIRCQFSNDPEARERLLALPALSNARSAGSIVAARQLLDSLGETLKPLSDKNELTSTSIVSICDSIVGAVRDCNSSSTLAEQVAAFCDIAATACETLQDYTGAAKRLALVPLDSGHRRVSPEDSARVWVRIVRNYLEVDDSTAAEPYLNKLKGVMHGVSDNELQLHFKLSQARINDAKRAFLAASAAYHNISLMSQLAEEERAHTLSMAIKCAVLAPAGPVRTRTLARLYKDDRAPHLEQDYTILEKMFLNRLIAPAEIAAFAETLQPHQLATTSDGSTVLSRAVVEHNVLAVSLLYRSIGLIRLATLLGIDAAKAEGVVARMIEQDRLSGHIDQLQSSVFFGSAKNPDEKAQVAVPVGQELLQWSANLQGLAEEVERVTDELAKVYPSFVETNLTV